MKLVVELEKHKKAKDGDVLIVKGEGFTTVPKEAYLSSLILIINELSEKIKTLEETTENIQKQLRIDHGEEE